MKRWRFIGLGLITVLVLLIWNRAPWDLQPQATAPPLQLSATAQSPSPSPEVEFSPEASPSPEVEFSPEVSPSPEVEFSPEASPSPEVEFSPEVSPSQEVEFSPEVSPSPEVEFSPEVSPSPEVEFSPEVSPSPEVEFSPEVSPSPEVEFSPEASPSPEVEFSPKASPSKEQLKTITMPLEKQPYQESRFEVGILEGYKVSQVGGVPLIESPDGNLAYTVVVKPQLNAQPFSNEALAELALEELERGEGFQPGKLRAIAPATVSLPWSGTLTQGRNSQPISGEVLIRQSGSNIFLLLISATETKASEVSAALTTLSNSFKPL